MLGLYGVRVMRRRMDERVMIRRLKGRVVEGRVGGS
jgi:hypothetical protein